MLQTRKSSLDSSLHVKNHKAIKMGPDVCHNRSYRISSADEMGLEHRDQSADIIDGKHIESFNRSNIANDLHLSSYVIDRQHQCHHSGVS